MVVDPADELLVAVEEQLSVSKEIPSVNTQDAELVTDPLHSSFFEEPPLHSLSFVEEPPLQSSSSAEESAPHSLSLTEELPVSDTVQVL